MNKTTEDILRLQAVTALMKEVRSYALKGVRSYALKGVSSLTPDEYADCVYSLLAAKQLLSFPFHMKGTEGLAERQKAKVEMLCTMLKAPTIEEWEAKRIEQGLE